MADKESISEPMPPTDEGLRCPKCEYNLTGLADDVCPECGEAFDRARLLAELAGADAPIPIWGRRDVDGVLRTFVLTALEIWIHPSRFGKRFPEKPELRGPSVFARICTCVAVGFVVLASAPLVSSNPSDHIGILAVLSGIFFGAILCEFLIAAAVFLPARAENPNGESLRSCMALVKMTRAFAIISAVPASIGIAYDSYLSSTWYDEALAGQLTLLVGVYWWLCLAIIAWAHTGQVSAWITALLMIPILTVISAFASMFLISMFFEVLQLGPF